MFNPLTIVSLVVCLMLVYIIYTKLKESSEYKLLHDMLLNVERKCEGYDTNFQLEINKITKRQEKIKENLSSLSVNIFEKLNLLESKLDDNGDEDTTENLKEDIKTNKLRTDNIICRIEAAENRISSNERYNCSNDETLKDLSTEIRKRVLQKEELSRLQNEITEIGSSEYLRNKFNEDISLPFKQEIIKDFNSYLNEEVDRYFKEKEKNIIELLNKQKEAIQRNESNLSILKNKILFLSIDVNKLSIEPTKSESTTTES